MRDILSISRLISGVIILITIGCSAPSKSDTQYIINELMKKQEVCWSSGDLECFMEPYWHSDSLKFIGRKGLTYGWQKTLENYKKSYPSSEDMGKLTFTNLYIEQLSKDYVSVIGKWHLERSMGNLEGHYSLLWKRMGGQWKIISDHSS
ncbi:nuclear transport factor 2 family protein [bacterium]|nr:nuclear transport factor 2 family protein [bacterium]